MSTNVWVFSVPRIVFSGNPLKAKKKKVDGSARGLPMMQEDGEGSKQGPRSAQISAQRPESKTHFPILQREKLSQLVGG